MSARNLNLRLPFYLQNIFYDEADLYLIVPRLLEVFLEVMIPKRVMNTRDVVGLRVMVKVIWPKRGA